MVLTDKLRRPSALAVAALLLFMVLVPLISRSKAGAYALLGERQIKMDNTATSATPVSYRVKFEVTTASNIGGVVVVFCEGADSPIIGDTACTVPAGFDLNGATVNGQSDGTQIQDDEDSGLVDTINVTGLTTVATSDLDDSGATTHNTLILSGGTPATGVAGDFVTFTINGVDNPSTLGTFYARIYTYDTNTEATGYTLANPDAGGASIDAGGVALSTARQITVTAKVQERLTFCVYTLADCATGGTSVNLGDTNGVLADDGAFIDANTKYDISTNAVGGAAIRLRGDTLTSGSNVIDPIGATPEGNAFGTEQFGFCTYQLSGTGLSVIAAYDGAQAYTVPSNETGAGCDDADTTYENSGTGTSETTTASFPSFAFDDNNTNGTTSPYGLRFATKAAGQTSVGVIAFLGNISATTEAGIYTTTLTFIATGTY